MSSKSRYYGEQEDEETLMPRVPVNQVVIRANIWFLANSHAYKRVKCVYPVKA